MDLRNGNITLAEVLQNPRAERLLRQTFPAFMNNRMMMRMGRNMTMNQIIARGRGHVSQQQINSLVEQLRNI